MPRCLRVDHSVRRIFRRSTSWRTLRLICAVWFALTSMGLPGSLTSLSGKSCARNPGSQCRCSVAKRLSGTCCCGRDGRPQVAKSCCSAKQSAPTVAESRATGCCSTKSQTPQIAASLKAELSIARCDCGSEFPENMSLAQEPRLLAAVSVMACPETDAEFVVLPVDRVESALLLPPIPPPKVVL